MKHENTKKIYKLDPILNKAGYPIGFVKLVMEAEMDNKYLEYVIVQEENRNKGYGKKAVKRFINHCKEIGIYQICANVAKDNIASIKILEHCGFIEFSRPNDEVISFVADLRFSAKKLKIIASKIFP
jgi:RimJ/RimL family protein N-acetyltransferase